MSDILSKNKLSFIIFVGVHLQNNLPYTKLGFPRYSQFKNPYRNLPDGVLVLNDQLTIIAVNSEAEKIFGSREISLQGLSITNLFTFAKNFFAEYFPGHITNGVDVFELHAKKSDGSTILTSLKFKQCAEAQIIICAVRDLTHVHEFEKDKLSVIVLSSEDAIISKDLNGNILSWNRGAEQLFQYKAEEVIGKNINIIIPPERLQEEETILAHIREEIPEKMETQRMRKDGSLVDVSVSISPLKDKNGKIIGAAKIARDITEYVKNINRLTSQNRQLDEFAHIIAHNFRSPVSNMQSLLYFYSTEKDEASKELYIEKLNHSVAALNETFDHLMDILFVKHNNIKQTQLTSFRHIYNKVLISCEAEIKKANAEITFDFLKAEEFYYLPDYLESIMQNLISNAIKYHHPERKPVIHIKTEKNQNKIALFVTDNGLGIDLKRYGQKLFGFHKTFHNHPNAKGVGLYLIKVQVESMGGKILVDSEVNAGSTFTVIF